MNESSADFIAVEKKGASSTLPGTEFAAQNFRENKGWGRCAKLKATTSKKKKKKRKEVEKEKNKRTTNNTPSINREAARVSGLQFYFLLSPLFSSFIQRFPYKRYNEPFFFK